MAETAEEPPLGGPFVQAAVFCEKVVEQADDNVTLVGVTDSATAFESHGESGSQYHIDITAFLYLIAGEVAGKQVLILRPRTPSGASLTEARLPVTFEAGASGVQIQIQAEIPTDEEGTYWFDLFLGEKRLLTRLPLRVRAARATDV
ncbi:MAG TPA: hypothetical protein VHJ34_03145 [Actinomycetota bacterium]|nr:hypothetical protein [Actinomycetota bacterium]